MSRGDSSLRCATCGVEVLLDTAPEGAPSALWFLDARGHVLERGIVGEGHLQLTGDGRLGETPSTVYCPGPVLPAPVVVDLREPVGAPAGVDVRLAAVSDRG